MYYIFNSQTHIHTYIDTISKIKNVVIENTTKSSGFRKMERMEHSSIRPG